MDLLQCRVWTAVYTLPRGFASVLVFLTLKKYFHVTRVRQLTSRCPDPSGPISVIPATAISNTGPGRLAQRNLRVESGWHTTQARDVHEPPTTRRLVLQHRTQSGSGRKKRDAEELCFTHHVICGVEFIPLFKPDPFPNENSLYALFTYSADK